MGETPVGILLWGLLGLVLFFSHGLQNRKEALKKHPLAVALLLCFYLGTFLSLFFSISLPLTLNAFILMSLAVCAFDFFYHSSPQKLPLHFLLYGILLIGLNISFLSTLFFFLPSLSSHLPGMNLLVANFGHNHASILYLFCIPIAFLVIQDSKKKWYGYVPLGILLITLVMSFARIDIAIGIAVIIFLWFISQKNNSKTTFPLKLVLASIVGCLVLGLFAVTKIKPEKICFAASVNRQTCKELTSDFRIQYWKQAVQSIIEKPLWGSGGGTFTVVSNQKAALPYYFSSYAHNEMLQLLAEYGLIFSLPFFGLVGYVLLVARPKNLSVTSPADILYVSVMSICIDSLFDFNLSYSVVWLLLLISLALLLREKEDSPKRFHQFQALAASPVPVFFSGVLVALGYIFLGLWMTGYLVSTVLWYSGMKVQSVKIFPVIYWRVQDQIKTSPEVSYLLSFYSMSPEVIKSYLLTSGISPAQEIELRQRLMKLTPFDLANKVQLLDLALNQNKPDLYLSTFENIRQTYQGEKIQLLDLSIKMDLFDQASTAVKNFSEKNIGYSAKIYLSMATFDSGLAMSRPFDAFTSPSRFPPNEMKKTIVLLQPTGFLVNYKTTLTPWLIGQMQYDLGQQQSAEAIRDVQLLLAVDDGNRWQTWNVYSDAADAMLKNRDANSDLQKRTQILDAWYQVWQLLDKNMAKETVEFSWKKILSAELAKSANQLYLSGDMGSATKLYLKAQQIDPDFESATPFPFHPSTYDRQLYRSFILELQKQHALDIFLAKYELRKQTQRLINELIEQKRWQLVQQLLISFSYDLRRDYFSSAQLANYYYLRGDIEAARREYDICLSNFKDPERETDCYWGKFDLDHQTQQGEQRYFRISQELLKS